MIFGKDLGRSAFFAEIGSEVERLDSIPSNYTNLVCIGQSVNLTDTVGREYRIDLFISPTGCIAVRLPLPLAGASPADADPKHLRRVASIVRAWSVEQLNEVCADHFYRAEGQAADIIDVLVRAGLAGFSDKGNVSKALAATLADGELLFEVIDSASAHKVFTSRELIDRFSAAKGVDPDDVTEFIGALEVMDGFSAVSIARSSFNMLRSATAARTSSSSSPSGSIARTWWPSPVSPDTSSRATGEVLPRPTVSSRPSFPMRTQPQCSLHPTAPSVSCLSALTP